MGDPASKPGLEEDESWKELEDLVSSPVSSGEDKRWEELEDFVGSPVEAPSKEWIGVQETTDKDKSWKELEDFVSSPMKAPGKEWIEVQEIPDPSKEESAIKPGSEEWVRREFSNSYARRAFLDVGRASLKALEAEPTSEKARLLAAALTERPGLLWDISSIQYAMWKTKGAYERSGTAMGALLFMLGDEGLSPEERAEAEDLKSRLYSVIMEKARVWNPPSSEGSGLAPLEGASSSSGSLTPTKEDFPGKKHEVSIVDHALGIGQETVMSIFQLVDIPAKVVAMTYMDEELDLDALTGVSNTYDPVHRARAIRRNAEKGQWAARGIVGLSRVAGAVVGGTLGALALAVNDLYSATKTKFKTIKDKDGKFVRQEAVQAKPLSYKEMLQVIADWDEGASDMFISLVTDPLMYVGLSKSGAQKALETADGFLSEGRLIIGKSGEVVGREALTATERVIVKEKIETAILAGSRAGLETQVLDGLKLKDADAVISLLKKKGITQKQIRDKEAELIKAQAKSLALPGHHAEVERLRRELGGLTRSLALSRGGEVAALASRGSYQEWMAKVRASLGDAKQPLAIMEGIDRPAMIMGKEKGAMHPLYPRIVKIAHEHGLPLNKIHKHFGKGGAFIGAAEMTALGRPIRIPGAGPYALRRALQNIGPKFEAISGLEKKLKTTLGKIPGVGRKIEASLDAVPGAGERLKRAAEDATSVSKRLGPKGFLFTYEGGPIYRAGRAINVTTHTKMKNRMIQNFRLMPEEMILEPRIREWVIENHVDPAFDLFPAAGLIPHRAKPSILEARARLDEALMTGNKQQIKEANAAVKLAHIENPPGSQATLAGRPTLAETPEIRRVQPQGLDVEIGTLPRKYYFGKDKKKMRKEEAFYGRRPYAKPSNILNTRRTFMQILNDPENLRTITQISLSRNALKKSEASGQVITFARNSDMEAAMDKLLKKAGLKKSDDPVFHMTTAGRNSEDVPAKYLSARDSEMRAHSYKSPSLVDMGFAKGFDEEGELIYHGAFKPTIRKDTEGDWYGVRHRLNGEEDLFTMTPKMGAWVDDLKNMMDDFHREMQHYRVLGKEQLGYNPLTDTYYLRDYSSRINAFEETLIPENPFSFSGGSKVRPEKTRSGRFGLPLGDKTRASRAMIDPSIDPKKVLPAYARSMSKRASQLQVELAIAEIFGIPKSRFMELYRVESNGRSVKSITTNPRTGSRLSFSEGKVSKRDQEFSLGDIGLQKKANEEWEKLFSQAVDKNGKERSGSLVKMMTNQYGEEVVLSAEAANWIKKFKGERFLSADSEVTRFIERSPTRLAQVVRGVRTAFRVADSEWKRVMLVATGGYHIINGMTDSAMLMARLGMYDPIAEFKDARKLLANPEAFSLKVKAGNSTRTFSGTELLAGARQNGTSLNVAERLDLLSASMPLEKQLELAAMRVNGAPFRLADWKKYLAHPLLTTATLRAPFSNIGLKQGEAFAAWWMDTTQLAGFLHQVKKGNTFTHSAKMALGATIDYLDRDAALRAVRLLMPFGTWAVKAPKAVTKAFVTRPAVFMVPVRLGDMIENVAIKQDGENLYLPDWMSEQGNYRRVPTPWRQLTSLVRRLFGGTELSEDEQLYMKQRGVPLFEALGPLFSTAQMFLSGGAHPWDPLMFQLGPKWRTAYEWLAQRDLFTKQPMEIPFQFTRPFVEGTPFPRRNIVTGGPIPSFTDTKGLSLMGNAAPYPGQQGWLSKNISLLAALPEIVPGQRLAFSRPGLSLLNMAQFHAGDGKGPPVVYGGSRNLTSREQGANLLAQSLFGVFTGYTPSVLTPGRSLGAMVSSDTSKQVTIDNEVAHKNLKRLLKRMTQKANQEAKELEEKQKGLW